MNILVLELLEMISPPKYIAGLGFPRMGEENVKYP
jgi:hypothetical protein